MSRPYWSVFRYEIPWASRVRASVLAALCGLVIWFSTLTLEQVNGNLGSYLLPAGAFAVGVLFPGQAGLIALSMTVPLLLVAGPTTPRGDEDGLWILIFPFLFVAGLCVLLPLAWLGGRLRLRWDQRVR